MPLQGQLTGQPLKQYSKQMLKEEAHAQASLLSYYGLLTRKVCLDKHPIILPCVPIPTHQAIRLRQYFEGEASSSAAVKRLRFNARFIVVCLLLGKKEVCRQLCVFETNGLLADGLEVQM